MKQTVEEAALQELMSSYAIVVEGELVYQRQAMLNMFRKGAEWQKEKAIEALSSVLEDWVHVGDADCIIAELEEKIEIKWMKGKFFCLRRCVMMSEHVFLLL